VEPLFLGSIQHVMNSVRHHPERSPEILFVGDEAHAPAARGESFSHVGKPFIEFRGFLFGAHPVPVGGIAQQIAFGREGGDIFGLSLLEPDPVQDAGIVGVPPCRVQRLGVGIRSLMSISTSCRIRLETRFTSSRVAGKSRMASNAKRRMSPGQNRGHKGRLRWLWSRSAEGVKKGVFPVPAEKKRSERLSFLERARTTFLTHVCAEGRPKYRCRPNTCRCPVYARLRYFRLRHFPHAIGFHHREYALSGPWPEARLSRQFGTLDLTRSMWTWNPCSSRVPGKSADAIEKGVKIPSGSGRFDKDPFHVRNPIFRAKSLARLFSSTEVYPAGFASTTPSPDARFLGSYFFEPTARAYTLNELP